MKKATILRHHPRILDEMIILSSSQRIPDLFSNEKARKRFRQWRCNHLKCCSQQESTFSAPKQPKRPPMDPRQVPTLTVGIGSDDALCRKMLEREVCAAATRKGISIRILATPCWDLLDTLFTNRKKPDLLIFHHAALSRAIDPVARAICQRYCPVRLLFLGGRIPDGDCALTTGRRGESVLVYSSLRRVQNQTALRRYLNRDMQWLLKHGAGQSSARYDCPAPKGGDAPQ